MQAQCVTVTDPFHPGRNRRVERVSAPCSIGHLAPKTEKPFIILRNGQAVLRRDWGTPVIDGDYCAVVMLPQDGGGDSNPLRVILMISVAVLAGPIAGALNTSLGLGFAANSWQLGLLQAGVGIVGATLVNALIPPPKLPSPQQMASLAEPSPTYSINAQGNQARLDSAIPVHYGRVRCFPDFAAQPYTEYRGNEQYLYQLFCIGQGEFDESTSGSDEFIVQIEDTDVSNFEDVEYEIVGPTDSVTLFPANVVTVSEVAGQELLDPDYIGPFTVNASGTQINKIGYDAVMPRGMYHVLGDGSLESVSITLKWEYREIDDDGNPVGVWTVAGTETITRKTTTPVRKSWRYSVTNGRYEVRATRTDTKQTDTTYGHEALWGSARGYMRNTRNYGNVTLLAMVMRASNQLSQQAARRINVICTRKLPIWNGSTWSANTTTKSIAWALADACRNDEYGADLADARIAADELLTLDGTWTTRGDEFNGRFDASMTFWEVLQQIGQAGRCKPYLQGGIVHFVRDQAETTPVALFSMRNIVKGSFTIEYILPNDETGDAIEVGYWDKTYWAPRRVQAKLSGSSAGKPKKMELFGVTDRDQAFREGMYQAASNLYRRRIIRFATEMEGFIPSVGDLIAIQHDMPAWGQFADAVDWDGGTRTLTLSEYLGWDGGGATYYVAFRLKDGSLEGPYEVTQGATDNIAVLVNTPTTAPYTGTDYERTQVTFGWSETWRQEARVLVVKPRGLYQVEIECVNEDPSVHTAETGETAPAIETSQLSTYYTAPLIADLIMKSTTDDNSKALLTWAPAPGADTYQIEMGPGLNPEDTEVEWTRVGETRASSYAVTAIYGAATLIRVRGVGLVTGPWVTLLYGETADYMWVDPSALMWSTTTSDLMWRY